MKIGIKWRWGIIIGLAVPIILIGTILYGFISGYRLLRHHEMVFGEIYDCSKGAKGRPDACNVMYRYVVDGKTYYCKALLPGYELQYEDCRKYLTGRNLPLVYDPGNTGSSALMLTPAAFRLYGYSFPDSLRWLQEYVKDK